MDDVQHVKEYFDCRAEQWDQICHHDPAKLEALATLADIQPDQNILDIACGTGAMFDVLLRRKPHRLVGVDLSDRMISVARQKYPLPNVELFAQDILEFSQTGFDTAFIYSAYPHFSNKIALCKKVWECLKTGGRFLVAHSEGRKTIDARHQSPQVQRVSTHLGTAEQEARIWKEQFDVDILIDTPFLYVISGVKTTGL
ncbi:class I SAM-dependent methyltransferase [uncultured Ruthenibacterium sp.]|uniref:class I SAM-dependent methyltransferase n=1 Tax=uncultured Ruthenibacterium sp. TaxID=1905347 RepID=UPI00349EB89F